MSHKGLDLATSAQIQAKPLRLNANKQEREGSELFGTLFLLEFSPKFSLYSPIFFSNPLLLYFCKFHFNGDTVE